MSEQLESKPTLVLDDKEYIIEDLSEQAKYLVMQLQDLEQQARSTKARLDQIEIARKGFTDLLTAELGKE